MQLNKIIFIFFCLNLVIWTAPVTANEADLVSETISSEAAYERLKQSGKLSNVIIVGTFDLAQLQSSFKTQSPYKKYRISDAKFDGLVRLVESKLKFNIKIDHSHFTQGILLQSCELQNFSLMDSVFKGDLIAENCDFKGISHFANNKFLKNVKIHFSRFLHRPTFRDTIFSGRAEFLSCEFGTAEVSTKAVTFSNLVFQGLAVFNHSRFATRAKFLSTRFEGDALFIDTKMVAGATFRNSHFNGDAEFRFCQMGVANFGDRKGLSLTLFAKRADFRGCTIESANFDYVEFRGKTSFVDVQFSTGGASFRYANFESQFVDFSGVTSAGPLVFDNTYAPTLHSFWKDIQRPLLKAEPDSIVLAAFLARYKASNDTESALQISYFLEHKKSLETVSRALPSIISKPAEYIDILSQRVIAYLELAIWGWPTGYGTKMGRIVLISFFFWLLFTLPVMTKKGLLAHVVRAEPENSLQEKVERKIYDPVYIDKLTKKPLFPESSGARLVMSLSFMFRLLFKVGSRNICYVVSSGQQAYQLLWKRYFILVWLFGSALLILISLTLANTSPLIKKLIGELLP